jgi:hypothetical protein
LLRKKRQSAAEVLFWCDRFGHAELLRGGQYGTQGHVAKGLCAWWRPYNAQHMLALRLTRANRQWDSYWQQISDTQRDQITTSV